jgi:hypothetical protein
MPPGGARIVARLVTGALGGIGAWVTRRPRAAGERLFEAVKAHRDRTARVVHVAALHRAGRLDARELEAVPA